MQINAILLCQKVVELKLSKMYCNMNWLVTVLQIEIVKLTLQHTKTLLLIEIHYYAHVYLHTLDTTTKYKPATT